MKMLTCVMLAVLLSTSAYQLQQLQRKPACVQKENNVLYSLFTQVDVLPPTDASKCKAYGPGLEKALVDRPAEFTVETKGAGAGGLSLAIEGPSEAKLTCNDHGDGTCSVKYTPVEPGDYEIHIKFADEHIPGSPFNAKVRQCKMNFRIF